MNRILTQLINKTLIIRRGLAGRGGKVGILVFGEKPGPELYLKVGRYRGENVSLEKEAANLKMISEVLSGSGIARSLPEVRFAGDWERRSAVGLSFLPGKSMQALILGREDWERASSLKLLEVGYRWLSEFRKTGWAHGDFCPKNLLVEGDRLNVVDWEYAFPNARPTFDLVYFSLKFGYWLFGQNCSDGREYAFSKTFIEPNWFASRVKEELAPFADLKPFFWEPLEFQAQREAERTGVGKNFWVTLLDYARSHQGEIK